MKRLTVLIAAVMLAFGAGIATSQIPPDLVFLTLLMLAGVVVARVMGVLP
jgi:hypothetical protein